MNKKYRMLLMLSLGFLLTTNAYAQVPSYVSIKDVRYAGSGCPAGTVAQDIAPDRKAFTLMFDSYVAEVGPGISRAQARKNCNINLRLDFPSGWSFTIVDVDFRGYVYLDRLLSGTQTASYHLQGDSRNLTFSSTYQGPVDQNYHFRDSLGISAAIWSPCNATRSLNINTSISLNNMRNSRGTGLMTTDTIDGSLSHIYHIRWRRC